MIIKQGELETVCGVTSKLPENTLPEIAFAGKSNVGKSSLINALMNRKSLARTSAQPGKTQTIENYLHKSKMLRCVFLLLDIRHEPSANDKLMYEWIVSQGFRPVIIATKLDKINRSQVKKQVKLLRDGLGLTTEDLVFPFSALSKQGREEIWEYIEGICGDDQLS